MHVARYIFRNHLPFLSHNLHHNSVNVDVTTTRHRVPPQVYHALKSVIKAKYGTDACNVGDEGGFAPNIKNNREGCELLMTAMDKAGHTGKVRCH